MKRGPIPKIGGWMMSTPCAVVIAKNFWAIACWLVSRDPFPIWWHYYCAVKYFSPWQQDGRKFWAKYPTDYNEAKRLLQEARKL